MTAAGNQAVQRSRRAHVSPTRRSQPLTAGAVLPAHTRVQLERQLGRSLGSVRVHTGDRAAAAARSLGALAFTTGRNIAFARGQYAPDTATGRRLLVHEIVHAALHADAQRIFRKCDPAGYPPAPDTCEFRDDVPAGRRFSYIVNCDEPRHGEDVAMAAFAKSLAPSAKVHVTGLASADGDATFNRSLSCHRADDAATRLSKAGAVVGRVTAAGPVGALGDDSNRAVVVEIDSPSPVPKPKPHSKPDPKPVDARMCGPAMDASLDATLGAVRSKFSAYTRIQREDNCAQLVSIDVF